MTPGTPNKSDHRNSAGVLWAVVAILAGGLLIFSQTGFSYVNEGFDLLAAQLIIAGKRPYIDFFYQHPPLFAYVSAGWMRVFGETWRSAHVLSALMTASSTALVGTFVFSRLSNPRWGLAAGICAAFFHGLNVLTVRYGTIGQAYSICLLLSMVALRLAVKGVEPTRLWLLFFAGLCAATATLSSLLIAPIIFILLIWVGWHSRSSHRLSACRSFVIGVAIPFGVFLGQRVRGLRQVFFDNIEYQLFYRRFGWEPQHLNRSDLNVLTSWLSSTQGILLVVFAILGLLSLSESSQWEGRRKAEFELCAWLTVVLGAFSASARPTFTVYFVLLIPFLSILASIGVYAVGSRIWPSGRPVWLVLTLSAFFAFELAQLIHQQPWSISGWKTVEEIARQVNLVTPKDGSLYVDDDRIYFAARRVPPQGLENVYAADLQLAPELSVLLHVVPRSRIDEWLAAGRFETVSVFVGAPGVESTNLTRIYTKHSEVNGRYVFWDKGAPSQE